MKSVATARLDRARSRAVPDGDQDRRPGTGGRAARRDGPLRRTVAADDDLERGAERAARLAGRSQHRDRRPACRNRDGPTAGGHPGDRGRDSTLRRRCARNVARVGPVPGKVRCSPSGPATSTRSRRSASCAAAQLAERLDEQAATLVRHGRYYLTFFGQADERLRSSAQRETLAELTAEMDNFRAAWDWAVTHGEFALIEQTMRLLRVVLRHAWLVSGRTRYAWPRRRRAGNFSRVTHRPIEQTRSRWDIS